jgi:hypothetical protein
LLVLGLFFSLLFFFYTVGRTPWTEDQPVATPLPAHRTTQTQNRRTQTFMPRVGFELTTPVFEREKTVYILGRAPTVIVIHTFIPIKNLKGTCNASFALKLHNELYNLYSSPNIIRIIKSRRMR